jgi:sensor c-di-GMP phosphodiesterase-like protein
MRPRLIAALCSLTLFIAGVLIINLQLWNSARNSILTAARQSTSRIDAILDEARLATDTIMPRAQGSCSPDTQFALSREAALRPHLRAVALLKGNTIWCSSFSGRYPLPFHQESISATQLTLYAGDQIAPGVPFLVWLKPFSGGHVAVSISDIHLRDALLPVQDNQQLTLIVGNRLLTHQGEVLAVETTSASPLRMRSSRYSFSTGYAMPSFFSTERLFRQGGMLLIMTALLSLTAGSLLRRYLAKYTTPAENLRKALERGEILPYYQPVVNGRTGEIEGLEVLARWKHPRDGFIPPDAFIPVAEKSGLIIPLTRYLMHKVQADLAPVIHHFPDNLHIAINVTAAQRSAREISSTG